MGTCIVTPKQMQKQLPICCNQSSDRGGGGEGSQSPIPTGRKDNLQERLCTPTYESTFYFLSLFILDIPQNKQVFPKNGSTTME